MFSCFYLLEPLVLTRRATSRNKYDEFAVTLFALIYVTILCFAVFLARKYFFFNLELLQHVKSFFKKTKKSFFFVLPRL